MKVKSKKQKFVVLAAVAALVGSSTWVSDVLAANRGDNNTTGIDDVILTVPTANDKAPEKGAAITIGKGNQIWDTNELTMHLNTAIGVYNTARVSGTAIGLSNFANATALAMGKQSVGIGYGTAIGMNARADGGVAIGTGSVAGSIVGVRGLTDFKQPTGLFQSDDGVALGNDARSTTGIVVGGSSDSILSGVVLGKNSVAGGGTAIGNGASVKINAGYYGTEESHGAVALGDGSIANRERYGYGYVPTKAGFTAVGTSEANDKALAAAIGGTAVTIVDNFYSNYGTAYTSYLEKTMQANALEAEYEQALHRFSDPTYTDYATAKKTLEDIDTRRSNLSDEIIKLRNDNPGLTDAILERDNALAAFKATSGAVSVGHDAVVKNGKITEARITRQITDVAAGTQDTDAVNVAQLKGLAQNIDNNKTHYFSVFTFQDPTDPTNTNFNNDGATNTNAIAVGVNTKADGRKSVAVGSETQALKENTIVIGTLNKAEGTNAIVIGNNNYQKADDGRAGKNSISLGTSVIANGEASIALGTTAKTIEKNTIAIGQQAQIAASSASAIALGDTASVSAKSKGSLAIGANTAVNTSATAVALGASTSVTSSAKAIALGTSSAIDTAEGAVLLGSDAKISKSTWGIVAGAKSQLTSSTNSILLGYSSVVDNSERSITMGGLVGVKDSESAIAIGYSSAVSSSYDGFAIGSHSDVTNSRYGMALGHVTMTTDSVSGTALGDYARVTKAPYGTALGSYSEVTASNATALGYKAKTAIQDGVALGSNSVAAIDKGQIGHDPATNKASTKTDLTWKSTLGAVSVGNAEYTDPNGKTVKANTRQITNLAAGTLDTDAVNVAQLKASKIELVKGTNISSIDTNTDDGYTKYTINAIDTKVTGGKANYTTDGTGTITLNTDANGTTSTVTINGLQDKYISNATLVNNTLTITRNDGQTVTVDGIATKGDITDAGNKTNELLARGFVIKGGTTDTTGETIALNGDEAPAITFDVKEDDKGLTIERDGKTIKYGIDATKLAENLGVSSDTLNSFAKVDATNLTDANVTKWKEKLGITSDELGQAGAWTIKGSTGSASIGGGKTVEFASGSYTTVNVEKTTDGAKVSIGLNDKATQAIENVNKFITTDENGSNARLNIVGDDKTGVKVEAQKDGSTKVSLDKKAQVGNITIDGTTAEDGTKTGEISGLTNTDWITNDPNYKIKDDRAATEGQLSKLTESITGDLAELNKAIENNGKNLNTDEATIGGNTTINEGGITINNPKTGNTTTITGDSITTNTVNTENLVVGGNTYITKDGINANNQTITNVAPGRMAPDSMEAVNGSQLYAVDQKVNSVGSAVNRLSNRVDKVAAGSAALAALHPLDFDSDDKLNFAVGFGGYKGEHAAALGAFYRANDDLMFSLGATIGNSNDQYNAGVSFRFGDSSPYTNMRKSEMANTLEKQNEEIETLKDRLAKLEALVAQK